MRDQKPTLEYRGHEPSKRPRYISIWFLLAGLLLIPASVAAFHFGVTDMGNESFLLMAVSAAVLFFAVPALLIAACVLFLTGR